MINAAAPPRLHPFLIALLVLAFLAATREVTCLDLWWHLAAGRWMTENLKFIATDPFSFTFQGHPWTSITWGYELVIYNLHRSGGIGLVALFHSLVAVAAVGFCLLGYRELATGERKPGLVAVVCVFSAAIWLAGWRWRNRPEMLSHLYGAAMIYLLLRDARASDRWIFVLPLIQVLWVNSHGLFLFGPALAALFLRTKLPRATLVLVLMGVACLVNPYGLQGALFPFHLLEVLRHPFYREAIAEGRGPFSAGAWLPDAWGLCLWALAALPATLAPGRDRLARVALFAILAWLSVAARRNIALFPIWTLPWVGAFWTRAEARLPAPWTMIGRRLAILLALTLGTSYVFSSGIVGGSLRLGLGPPPGTFPDGAVDFFRKSGFRGRIFADIATSDYFLFQLPGYQPYIDGRLAELYPLNHSKRAYALLEHPELFETEAKKWDLSAVALGTSTPSLRGFASALLATSRWKPGYFDSSSLVLLRSDASSALPPPAELYKMKEAQLWKEADRRGDAERLGPLVDLASVALMLDLPRQSLDTATAILALSPRHSGALGIACLARFASQSPDFPSENENEKIKQDCARALESSGVPALIHLHLGMLGLKQGHPESAERHFSEGLRTEPRNFELNMGAALAKTLRGRDAEARTALTAITDTWPEKPLPWVLLAENLARTGAKDEARKVLLRGEAATGGPLLTKEIRARFTYNR